MLFCNDWIAKCCYRKTNENYFKCGFLQYGNIKYQVFYQSISYIIEYLHTLLAR